MPVKQKSAGIRLEAPVLRRFFAANGIEPTEFCCEVLNWASYMSGYKLQRRLELSCTSVFLACMLLGPAASRAATKGGLLERNSWISFQSRMQNSSDRLEGLFSSYFSIEGLRIRPGVYSDVQDVSLRATLQNALKEHRTFRRKLNVFDLLLAVLTTRDANLNERLSAAGLDRAEIVNELEKAAGTTRPEALDVPETSKVQRPPRKKKAETLRDPNQADPGRPGDEEAADFKPYISREIGTDAQLGLSVDVYAAALATVMRTALGEFCFGLFGPWGIGKTLLVRRLTPLLESPERYGEAMSRLGSPVAGDRFDALRYGVVWYSAWKYRRPPEAWIYLYEAMAQRAMDTTLLRKLCRAVRAGVARRGYFPLTIGLLLLGLFAIPQAETWTQLFTGGVGVIGLGGLVYATGMIQGGGEKARSFAARYAMLSRHGERLGLQALIGADLRALLLGWIPAPKHGTVVESKAAREEPSDFFSRHAALCATAAIALFCPVWFAFMWFVPVTSHFYCAAFAAWGALSSGVLAASMIETGGPDRVLLVVDDLDRCSPSEVIDIADSLKLLLEDDDIRDRVQIMMLVDEDILDHAIADKFGTVTATRAAAVAPAGDAALAAATSRRVTIVEHVEKLFACYLRLPVLRDSEIGGLVRKFTQFDATAEPPPQPDIPSAAPLRHGANEVPVLESGPAGDGVGHVAVSPAPEAATHSPESAELRYTKLEIDLLEREVAGCLKAAGRRASPRSIRIFLFKYRLCRLLIQLSRNEDGFDAANAEPKRILGAMSAAVRADPSGKAASGRATLDCIVRQVA